MVWVKSSGSQSSLFIASGISPPLKFGRLPTSGAHSPDDIASYISKRSIKIVLCDGHRLRGMSTLPVEMSKAPLANFL